jgi:ATP-binding cassette subfamily C (CFTR/MRP) protein 2
VQHDPGRDFTLSVPSLLIAPGELVAVVGQVAAGKSSLCSALLGEMTRLQGAQSRPAHVAICQQDPFILNETVRANILFGKDYDKVTCCALLLRRLTLSVQPAQERYDQAISCSAMARDLETLPGSDAAEIGERGINLSGGQKARVALARWVRGCAQAHGRSHASAEPHTLARTWLFSTTCSRRWTPRWARTSSSTCSSAS